MLRATQALAHLSLERPTLLVDARRVHRNIQRMAGKAAAAGAHFRPHFKTHQSATIGEWFRDAGVKAITVSSLDMARYFARHGWSDITVAFPVNVREVQAINRLAAEVTLHVLVDSHDALQALEAQLTQRVNAWIEVDVGGRRSGVPWSDLDAVMSLAQRLRDNERTGFVGLLTHAGHSYDAEGAHAIRAIHAASLSRMARLRSHLADGNIAARVSIGDTPCCSLADDFAAVDELRPGNFVFYDMTQVSLGSCRPDDVAISVACPVVSKHAERGEIVVYGGAVHMSKDRLDVSGQPVYGYLAAWADGSWSGVDSGAPLVSLSQEHGIVRLDADRFDTVAVGDLVAVLPVHSCLTSDLYTEYRGLDGRRIARRQSNQVSA
jgi:D-serine deaminase-like pyridoxal phosphate-dependent protein